MNISTRIGNHKAKEVKGGIIQTSHISKSVMAMLAHSAKHFSLTLYVIQL